MNKHLIYDETARIAKAIGHPSRARILDLVFQSERHVEDLAQMIDMGITAVSNHLAVLRNAGLVEQRKEGTRIYYRMADDTVLHAWLALRAAAESRSPHIRELLLQMKQRDQALDPIDAHDALRLAKQGKVALVDVRPKREFDSGHLPGAISMPPDQVDDVAPQIPKGKDVIAYCRDRYCVYAPNAAAVLQSKGISTRVLEIGVAEWHDLGLPVENEPTEI